MKILIIADQLNSIKPHSDTGLMLAFESNQRNHEVYWTTPECVGLMDNKTYLKTQKIKSIQAQELPELESDSFHELSFFDTVWIRKDPPFNTQYVSLCWLLRLTEKNKPLVLNSPDSLLLCHEKILPMIGLHQGFFSESDLIPSALSFEGVMNNTTHPFFHLFKNQEAIVKPWLGHGGQSIEKLATLREVPKYLALNKTDTFLIQPFQKEVETLGDRRAFFIAGKHCGGFIKLPKDGGYISNFAQGGTGVLKELTEREEEIIPKIEKFLQKNNIFIAGADIINGFVSEINITAPTLFQTYKKLTGGVDLAVLYVDEVEKLVLKN